MSVGVVLLVHEALHRAAQVARHWAAGGCPIVIHVDAKVKDADYAELRGALADIVDIRFAERHNCEWGTFSIVAATQAAAQQMLDDFPDVSHVFLASGACLPLRPIADLAAYLTARPKTDFIESVTTEYVMWTIGGLDAERFTLRFPFSWKRQRRLFDSYVAIQRALGMRRRIPKGLTPHMGSQWWCLTRQTLSAILQDPERPKYDRYFRKVWVPDESYFQTLARRYSINIESRSLTLSKFDFEGKPHTFYDDHLQLLKRSDCFVARKIWPSADKLYDAFLGNHAENLLGHEPNPGKIDRLFSRAIDRRLHGRPGLIMQSRQPNPGREKGLTAQSYAIFHGFTDIIPGFQTWLARSLGVQAHGHLFAPDRAEFSGNETMFAGALSDSAKLRDYDPKGFLTNLLWNARGQRQCFQFSPRDNQKIIDLVEWDENAQVAAITGAWAVPLFHSNQNFADIRAEAARLQRREDAFIKRLKAHEARAKVRVWSLTDFLEAPMDCIMLATENVGPPAKRNLTEVPEIADLKGFDRFLQNLRNQGMSPYLVGDFNLDLEQPDRPTGQRPYAVR